MTLKKPSGCFFGIYTKWWTGISRVETEKKTPNCD